MAKVHYDCTMQEGQVGKETRARLADSLAAVTEQALGVGTDDISVEFSDIPQGFAFRAGEPSTTSLVRGSVEGGLEQPTRVELMRTICDTWMEISGCTVDELVVSVRDA